MEIATTPEVRFVEGGKRADGAEKGREAQVNNGHSRSTTDTRKPTLTWDATL
jgi:hypothetical protein